MPYEYSDPTRAHDNHAIPDIEIFRLNQADIDSGDWGDACEDNDHDHGITEHGYYYWHCLPGCLPDSSPVGPFASYADALADARSQGE